MLATELALADQPFFYGIDPNYLDQIAECAFTTHFEAGEYICREGEPANRFYILTGGHVALETHIPGQGTKVVQTINEWEALGWSWLFPPYRWHFDAKAITTTDVLAFDALCLRGKCEQDHNLGYELMTRFAQVLIERLQAARLQMMDVYNVTASR